jgi:hypothetical protein
MVHDGGAYSNINMQLWQQHDANEVCVVGLKVGCITYSWSYCWFLQKKWFYCWFQSPKSSRVTVRCVWLVYRLVI